ncbi:uncharacterized protein LOC143299936 [Babylonia areolata]|uniref:uncharacterized protein LOC143299936 n=1 Tax=Babylonia areolata TaxID=304850 RepID=UPI003FD3A187
MTAFMCVKMGFNSSSCSVLLLFLFFFGPVCSSDCEKACPKANPFLLWVRRDDGLREGHPQPLSYRQHPQPESLAVCSDQRSPFVCVKADGVEPPEDLTSFTTSLLHERDVMHQLTWEGSFWTLGSGAFAHVHLGRLEPGGQCVVVKQFVHSPLSTIEREIQIHRSAAGTVHLKECCWDCAPQGVLLGLLKKCWQPSTAKAVCKSVKLPASRSRRRIR